MVNPDPAKIASEGPTKFNIVGLNYVSFYLRDFAEAVDFYTSIFGGDPEHVYKEDGVFGLRLGSTWLTLFPASAGTRKDSNPCNSEFAIQLALPEDVDALYDILTKAGAHGFTAPLNTRMYEPMRFAVVDDPFGIRIDLYCPTPTE